MSLQEKYTPQSVSEAGKQVLSNDAYAICEFIESLKQTIRSKRMR